MRTTVVSQFLLLLCWPYQRRQRGVEIQSTSLARTLIQDQVKLPYPKDRLIAWFLSGLAAETRVAYFNVTEIGEHFGVKWRKRESIKRLRRVLACRFGIPTRSDWKFIALGNWCTIDTVTGDTVIEFTDEFICSAQTGVPYSRDVARQLVGRIAVLELYLFLLYLIQRGEFRDRWEPYQLLRAAKSRSKIGQLLRQRMHYIQDAWQACPFRIVKRGCAIICDREAYRQHAFGIDEQRETRRLDTMISGKSRDEFRKRLAATPSWMRERLLGRYFDSAYRHILKPANKPNRDVLSAVSRVTRPARAMPRRSDSSEAMARTGAASPRIGNRTKPPENERQRDRNAVFQGRAPERKRSAKPDEIFREVRAAVGERHLVQPLRSAVRSIGAALRQGARTRITARMHSMLRTVFYEPDVPDD